MQNVQRASKLSYTELLGNFNLEPLELRRLRYDLVQYYKILYNLTPLNPTDYFKLHCPLTSAKDPSPIIMIVKPIRYSSKVLIGCFFYRVSVGIFATLSYFMIIFILNLRM